MHESTYSTSSNGAKCKDIQIYNDIKTEKAFPFFNFEKLNWQKKKNAATGASVQVCLHRHLIKILWYTAKYKEFYLEGKA